MRQIPTVDERIRVPDFANEIKLHAMLILDGEPGHALRQITIVKSVSLHAGLAGHIPL